MAKKRKHVLPTEDVPIPDPWAVIYEGLTTKQEIMENVEKHIITPLCESIIRGDRRAPQWFFSSWQHYRRVLLESKGESMEAFLNRFKSGIFDDEIADFYKDSTEGKKRDWWEIRKRVYQMLLALRKERDGK